MAHDGDVPNVQHEAVFAQWIRSEITQTSLRASIANFKFQVPRGRVN